MTSNAPSPMSTPGGTPPGSPCISPRKAPPVVHFIEAPASPQQQRQVYRLEGHPRTREGMRPPFASLLAHGVEIECNSDLEQWREDVERWLRLPLPRSDEEAEAKDATALSLLRGHLMVVTEPRRREEERRQREEVEEQNRAEEEELWELLEKMETPSCSMASLSPLIGSLPSTGDLSMPVTPEPLVAKWPEPLPTEW